MFEFLTVEEAIALNVAQIERYSPSEDIGVRSKDLLTSAVEAPQASFGGVTFYTDLFDIAAVYCYHIAANHPFQNANKRTGLAAALAFLELNGTVLISNEKYILDAVLAAVQLDDHRAAKQLLADVFRKLVRPEPHSDRTERSV